MGSVTVTVIDLVAVELFEPVTVISKAYAFVPAALPWLSKSGADIKLSLFIGLYLNVLKPTFKNNYNLFNKYLGIYI